MKRRWNRLVDLSTDDSRARIFPIASRTPGFVNDNSNGSGDMSRCKSMGDTEEKAGRSKQSRRREQLIAALLSQPNLEKAAAAIGISVSTAYRIRKTPEFPAEYLQARRDVVSQAGARLQQGCGAAISILLQTMVDRNSPPACKVRAAAQVLEQARKLLESEDQELRIRRVEQQVAELVRTSH